MKAGLHASKSNQRFIFLILIPFVSCVLSSVVGVVTGQVGNLVYAAIGDSLGLLCIPAYCLLFFFTAGFCFLVSNILKRLFQKSEKQN